MQFRTLVALSTVAALGAAPLHEAWSASPTVWGTSPTATLGSFFERANSVLRSADPMRDLESSRRAIRGLVAEVFDFREAASIALGPVWRARTPQEQEEFIHLFADLLERGYIAVFSSKASLSGGGVTVHYLAESVTGESASLPTRVLTRTGEELPVEYRLVRRGERWTVRDVIVDGVSLVANYRAQFTRILGTSTFTDLMVRMRSGPEGSIFAAVPRAPATGAAAVAMTTPAAPAASSAESPAPAPDPKPQDDVASKSSGVAPLAFPGLLNAPAVAPPNEPATASKPDRPTAVGPALAAKPDRAASSTAPVVKPERPAPVAKAAAAPPASTTASLVPSAKFWVQLGAFKTLEAARLLASTLHPQTAIISSGPGPGAGATALNRVRIGPFAELAQAAAKLRELDHRGYPGFIALTQD